MSAYEERPMLMDLERCPLCHEYAIVDRTRCLACGVWLDDPDNYLHSGGFREFGGRWLPWIGLVILFWFALVGALFIAGRL